MLDYAEKTSKGTNTLAYFAAASATKKKSFITLTPDDENGKPNVGSYPRSGADVINLFCTVIYKLL